MTKIKLTVFALMVLTTLSCKQESRNKEASSSTTESPILSEKMDNQKEKDITRPIKMAKDCDQTFDDFFVKFAKDSTFQKSRVKYPMEWYFYGSASYASLDKEIINSKDKFRYFDFTRDKEAIEREYGVFKVEKTKHKDSVIYKRIGLDSGLLMNFKFYLINDCWYLVEILDEST